MSNKKTVFIIGAGASKEANLPTAQELKQTIANLLDLYFEYDSRHMNGDYDIYQAINIHIHNKFTNVDITPYIHAALHICKAMPQSISIDNFIDTHKDDKKIELCGKLAIVKAILEAERNSLLYIEPPYFDNKMNFNTLETKWYGNFFKLLTENCTKDNLSQRLKSTSLIVFNYDRCIEHFLYNSFQNYYGFEPNELGKLFNEIEIYHPYGVVGSLNWQQNPSTAFGSEVSPIELLNLADQIKTFTEGTDPHSSEIQAIHNNINTADMIVFLGFAYHDLNMELLMPENSKPDTTKLRSCFGTAYNISDHNCKLIEIQLRAFFNSQVEYVNINNQLKCSDLFNEYWRSLSLV